MIRKLTVVLSRSGDVLYKFYRSEPLKKLLIEHPPEKVSVCDKNELKNGGCVITVTEKAFLELSWDKPNVNSVSYVKESRFDFPIYEETFVTKQGDDEPKGFWFWLELKDEMQIDKRRSHLSWNGYDLSKTGSYIEVPDTNSPYPDFYKRRIAQISLSEDVSFPRALECSFYESYELNLKLHILNGY